MKKKLTNNIAVSEITKEIKKSFDDRIKNAFEEIEYEIKDIFDNYAFYGDMSLDTLKLLKREAKNIINSAIPHEVRLMQYKRIIADCIFEVNHCLDNAIKQGEAELKAEKEYNDKQKLLSSMKTQLSQELSSQQKQSLKQAYNIEI